MLSIAIVDDDKQALSELKSVLVDYFTENKITDYQITPFYDGSELLTNYDGKWDIIYLDIDMAEVNGYKTARAIRAKQDDTAIVFITRLARYAIKCYDVNAWDFIVKPINPFSFKVKLAKLLKHIEKNVKKKIQIANGNDTYFVELNEIYYVEVRQHELIYHTLHGDIKTWGTSLSKAVEMIGSEGFCFCNRCYYVNLRYVSAINENIVTVGGEKLEISRNKKKMFMTALASYLGQGDKR